jgi:hypothetical protein
MDLPKDIHFLIINYLGPYDLTQCRLLSSYFFTITSEFLENTLKTTKLENLVCPMCGIDWIYTNNEPSFFDLDMFLHTEEIEERLTFIQTILDCKESNQEHFFCQTCEINCSELNYLPSFKINQIDYLYHLYFDRFTEYPWICIIKQRIKDGEKYWNQYAVINVESIDIDIRIEFVDDDW